MRTHLDLFSGIGGFSLAARWNGLETIGFAEIDPCCCRVLETHWPGVPNYGDVRTVPAVQCDLLTGGFPCQPFSCAGKRRGKADDRYLWPAMLAVIDRCRPAWVLGENVPGIANMVLDDLQSDLAQIGYQSQAFVIPACAVDALHRRDRVWIVANDDRRECRTPGPREAEAWTADLPEHGGASGGHVAHTESERINRERRNPTSQATTRDEGEPESDCRGEAAPDARRWDGKGEGEIERGRSKPARWLPEPDVGRVAHGVPNRVDRLRALGNAIVPQVASEIIRCIIAADAMTI